MRGPAVGWAMRCSLLLLLVGACGRPSPVAPPPSPPSPTSPAISPAAQACVSDIVAELVTVVQANVGNSDYPHDLVQLYGEASPEFHIYLRHFGEFLGDPHLRGFGGYDASAFAAAAADITPVIRAECDSAHPVGG